MNMKAPKPCPSHEWDESWKVKYSLPHGVKDKETWDAWRFSRKRPESPPFIPTASVFHDSEKCLPAIPGKYQMKSKQMGGYVPVIWNGAGWEWLNGESVPSGIVRWWRHS